MSETIQAVTDNAHPAIRPVHLGLFPVMDSLESVIDLGLSQLPITTPNELMAVLMTYHNTLIKVQHEQKAD